MLMLMLSFLSPFHPHDASTATWDHLKLVHHQRTWLVLFVPHQQSLLRVTQSSSLTAIRCSLPWR